jgi:hypothetical protein
MPFVDTSSLDVIERLAGWYGRYFQSREVAFLALFDGCCSAKRIRAFLQQTRVGSSQWRNQRSRMTWRENHWFAKRIRARELTNRAGR